MEGYYSSDDDVAWGPYTLREAKRDIREGLPSKTDRRHTYSGFLNTNSKKKSFLTENQKIEHKNMPREISGKVLEEPIKSEAFVTATEAEDINATEIKAESMEEFVTDMQQRVRGKKAQDQSMLNFLKLANQKPGKISMFGNAEPTLVENTIIISSDEEVDIKIVKQEKASNSYMLDNTCYDTSSEVEMIEMDDTSETDASRNMTNLDNSMICSFSDNKIEEGTNEHEVSPQVSVCNNSNISKLRLDSEPNRSNCYGQINETSVSSSTSNKIYNKDPHSNYEQYYNNLSECSSSNSNTYNNKAKEDDEIAFSSLESVNEKPDIENIIKRLSSDLQIEDSLSASSMGNSVFGEIKNLDVKTQAASESHKMPDFVNCYQQAASERHKMPDFVISSYDTVSTSPDSSHVFNDTLEEIEMVLKYGLDYKMPVDIKSSPSQEIRGSSSYGSSRECENVNAGAPLKHNISPKLEGDTKQHVVASCIPIGKFKKHVESHHIRPIKQEEVQSSGNFKVPHVLSRQKITPSKSPSSHNKKFKDIMSPVGIYIKQSPAPFIKRNVISKDISSKPAKRTPEVIPLKNIENTSLPQVVYKPSRKQIVFKEKEVVLPKSIKNLICEAEITKNEGRITKKANDISVGTELEMFEEDLTCVSMDENTLDMTGDISILCKKQGFIK